jgi:hypothetical protein
VSYCRTRYRAARPPFSVVLKVGLVYDFKLFQQFDVQVYQTECSSLICDG